MIISRLISVAIRGLEFACAFIVIGLNGFLMHLHHTEGTGPWGRYIFTECLAAFAVVLSLVWIVPFTWTFMHYPIDIFMSVAWFASFGALINWIHRIDCARAFVWFGYEGWTCNLYKTNEAFVFISAVLWLLSSFLSCWVFHTKNRDATEPRTSRIPRRSKKTVVDTV